MTTPNELEKLLHLLRAIRDDGYAGEMLPQIDAALDADYPQPRVAEADQIIEEMAQECEGMQKDRFQMPTGNGFWNDAVCHCADELRKKKGTFALPPSVPLSELEKLIESGGDGPTVRAGLDALIANRREVR